MLNAWQKNCFQKVKEQQRQFQPLKICVLGEKNAGKSTLIDVLFEQIPENSVPLTIQEITIDDSGLNVEAFSFADVILYCVTSEKEQISKKQQQWLMKLGKQKKVIVVITRAIGTKSEVFQQTVMQLQLPIQAIVTLMAKPFPIYEKIVLPAFGLEELMDSLEEIIFGKRETLIAVQQISLSKKNEFSRKYMQKALMQVYGHHLGDVVALDWRQLLTEQQLILAKSLVVFSNEQKVQRLLGMLESVLQQEQRLKQALATTTQTVEPLTGLSACIVANAVIVSACEVLSLMYKKEDMDLVLNSEELTSLLETKIFSRLKQGKQNQDIQQLMQQQHFDPNTKEKVEIQRPTIHVQRKKPDMLHRVKAQSAKILQHSLEHFSSWIRKS